MKSISGLILILLLSSMFFSVEEEKYDPIALYLTWQQDPATTMTIDWHSLKDEQRTTVVEYRLKGEELWNNSFGSEHDFPYSERIIHRVELTELQPDAKYEFRFGDDSKAYTFRTMPGQLTRPLRIAIGGDTMHHQDFFEETNRQILKYDPDFTVVGGDIAYADAVPPEEQGIRGDPQTRGRADPRPGLEEGDNLWYHWFDGYKNTLITESGRVIPMLVAIGNHEASPGYYYNDDDYEQTDEKRMENAPYFYSFFAMPGQPGYEVLDFGDYMSMILLDSDHTNPVDGEQTEWLEQVLAERQDVAHVFPNYHVPAYPSVRDTDGRIPVRIREHWVPLFEQYNVKIAFENHDHAYKRTHPIRDGQINHNNGVIYIGDGSWGTVPRGLGGRRMAVTYDAADKIETQDLNPYGDEYWYIRRAESVMHFILLTIEGQHQHMFMVDSKGNIIDEYPETPKVRRSSK